MEIPSQHGRPRLRGGNFLPGYIGYTFVGRLGRHKEAWEPRGTLSSRIGMIGCEEKRKVSSVPVYTKTKCGCYPGAGMTFRHLFWPAVVAILAIVGALEVRSARGETQTWDEGIHIVSGFSYLKFGDYSWNVEHPPLVKMVSALPLVLMGLTAAPYLPDGKRRDQVQYGIDFLYKNRRHADSILLAARSANRSESTRLN